MRKTWVVHGSDGSDEITTTGITHVASLEDGKVITFDISPGDAGLPTVKPEDLKGGDEAHNAAAIRSLLNGERSAYRDVVLLNAAAALIIAGEVDELRAGVVMAAAAIDGGQAQAVLDKLVEITNIRREPEEEEDGERRFGKNLR